MCQSSPTSSPIQLIWIICSRMDGEMQIDFSENFNRSASIKLLPSQCLSFKHTQQWHCPEQQIVCQASAEKRQTNVAVVCIVFHPILHAKKIHINNHSNERKDDLPLSAFLRMKMMLSIIAPHIQCWQTGYLFRYFLIEISFAVMKNAHTLLFFNSMLLFLCVCVLSVCVSAWWRQIVGHSLVQVNAKMLFGNTKQPHPL